MKTMTSLTPEHKHLIHSKSCLLDAFNSSMNATHRLEVMRSQLCDDISCIDEVLGIAWHSDLSDEERAKIKLLMSTGTFKEINDRVNHLTSPEMYSRLAHECPYTAEGYMLLKTALGQLDLAVNPPTDDYSVQAQDPTAILR